MRTLLGSSCHVVITALSVAPAASGLLAPKLLSVVSDIPATHRILRNRWESRELLREEHGESKEERSWRSELEVSLEEAAFDFDHLPFETDLAAGFRQLASRTGNEPLVDGSPVKEAQEQEPETLARALWRPVKKLLPFTSKPKKYTIAEPLANITRQKPFLWVHIHKAGGTFMCALAKLAGENIVEPSDGACNWRGHDQYKNSGPKSRLSCEAREEYFLNVKQNFTWGQIEREFVDEDRCWDQFDYGVTLRDPVELLQSEINYHPGCWLFGGPCGGGPDHPEKFLQSLNKTLMSPPASGGKDQFPLWKFFDNIQTRLLAPALDAPPGGINSTHVSAAKKTLKKMKVVIRLEDMPTRGPKLFKALGWPKEMMQHVGQRVNPSEHDFQFSKKQIKWLKEVNRHDQKLYDLFDSNQ